MIFQSAPSDTPPHTLDSGWRWILSHFQRKSPDFTKEVYHCQRKPLNKRKKLLLIVKEKNLTLTKEISLLSSSKKNPQFYKRKYLLTKNPPIRQKIIASHHWKIKKLQKKIVSPHCQENLNIVKPRKVCSFANTIAEEWELICAERKRS